MNLVVAIIGPTGIGKSQLALDLADKYTSQIISADSRQIYRYMDIGTAKPGAEQMNRIKHHLIDIIDPDEEFSLALYQGLAFQAINKCQATGHLPLFAGGSGLYIWSVLEGWKVPKVPPDKVLRRTLENRAGIEGGMALYKELEIVDPEAARQIDWHNRRRVIRALEVYLTTGVPFSRLQIKEKPGFKTLIIGLTTSRDELYRRIDRRVDNMIEKGLVSEVQSLLGKGYDLKLPSMSSLGYRQIGYFLEGKMSLDEAIQQIKFETHRFARQQYAWFHPNDTRINWLDVRHDVFPEACGMLHDFIYKNDRISI